MTTALHPSIAAMGGYRQWICWRAVPRGNKVDKVPTDPRTGGNVDAHDPAAWMPVDEAIELACAAGLGVGFVLTQNDPFFFLDLDGCVDDDGRLSSLATGILGRFPGAAVETSVSGQGIHVFGCCVGDFSHGKKNTALHIELYRDGRFAALGSAITTASAWGDCTTDFSGVLPAFAAEFFPGADISVSEWSDKPREGYRSTLTDEQLIKAACAQVTAKEAFGDGVTFSELWNEDVDKLSAKWASEKGDDYDRSSADFSLMSKLCFWTGCNHERVERLMRLSGLVREKWDRSDGIFRKDIARAVGSYYGKVLGEGTGAVSPPPGVQTPTKASSVTIEALAPAAEIRSGPQMLFPDQQRDYFAGCVYIPAINKTFVPRHGLISNAAFRAIYDGHSFTMSNEQGAKIVTNAWDAFTGSHVNPTPLADGVTFRPGQGTLVDELGESHVNMWRPVDIRRVQGDASPFIHHIQRLLPFGEDATILLSYLAAIVQNPGVKFTWCPVLQGVEGNGKSTIADCMRRAVGKKYVYVLPAEAMGTKFNSWVARSIFVAIDDITITRNRVEAMERIKPIITGDYVSVEHKGVDAAMQDVCANFMLSSNHQDALLIGPNQRRFAVLFCAQQNIEDLETHGLTQEYFARLTHWLKGEDGYAIVAEWLHTVAIEDRLNPATACKFRPRTTSHAEAIEQSLSIEAQHIKTAADEERIGFRDGWVSTIRAREMLADVRGANTDPRKLAGFLKASGYVQHPHLVGGKVGRHVSEESGRPRLYLREGHEALAELESARIAHLYCSAQGYQVSNSLAALP